MIGSQVPPTPYAGRPTPWEIGGQYEVILTHRQAGYVGNSITSFASICGSDIVRGVVGDRAIPLSARDGARWEKSLKLVQEWLLDHAIYQGNQRVLPQLTEQDLADFTTLVYATRFTEADMNQAIDTLITKSPGTEVEVKIYHHVYRNVNRWRPLTVGSFVGPDDKGVLVRFAEGFRCHTANATDVANCIISSIKGSGKVQDEGIEYKLKTEEKVLAYAIELTRRYQQIPCQPAHVPRRTELYMGHKLSEIQGIETALASMAVKAATPPVAHNKVVPARMMTMELGAREATTMAPLMEQVQSQRAPEWVQAMLEGQQQQIMQLMTLVREGNPQGGATNRSWSQDRRGEGARRDGPMGVGVGGGSGTKPVWLKKERKDYPPKPEDAGRVFTEAQELETPCAYCHKPYHCAMWCTKRFVTMYPELVAYLETVGIHFRTRGGGRSASQPAPEPARGSNGTGGGVQGESGGPVGAASTASAVPSSPAQ
jgi:hypothetical protein